MTNCNTTDLASALAAAARAFLAALEAEATETSPTHVDGDLPTGFGEALVYDPLTDEPPFPVNPVGSRTEQKMTSLAYLGAVARINAEARRGANTDEISQYAKVAGYRDGRVVNGWNSRPGSGRQIENVDGARILNASGHAYLRELADELNITIKGDITPLPLPLS